MLAETITDAASGQARACRQKSRVTLVGLAGQQPRKNIHQSRMQVVNGRESGEIVFVVKIEFIGQPERISEGDQRKQGE